MRRQLVFPACFFVLSACGQSDGAIQEAVREGLSVQEGARFGAIEHGSFGSTKFACATVDAKNKLGMYLGPHQVPIVKRSDGKWQAFEPVEGQTSKACIENLTADLSGANDSVPPSSFTETHPRKPKDAAVPFDRNEVRWFESYGDNVIQGTAQLRSRSGNVYSCSDDPDAVGLIPASTYARQRMKLMYGNDESGFLGKYPDITESDLLYQKMIKTTGCDGGQFIFQNLPDGEYFVTASVSWGVYKMPPVESLQGGTFMRRVRVTGGQVSKVSLTAK